ncbi:hypothetical protein [Streptomyces sp. NPDC055681]
MDEAAETSAERLKLSYESALKQLEAQDRTLTNVRNRSTGLFATTSFIVALSTTLGLAGLDGGVRLPLWAALLLLSLIVVQGILAMTILWPVNFHHGPDIVDILNPRLHAASENCPSEHMVEDLIECLHDNNHTINGRSLLYQGVIICLLGEVATVVAAVISLR